MAEASSPCGGSISSPRRRVRRRRRAKWLRQEHVLHPGVPGPTQRGNDDLSRQIHSGPAGSFPIPRPGNRIRVSSLSPSAHLHGGRERPDSDVRGRTVPRERADRALEFLKAVGLGHRLKHYPSELSGGERQRVAVARRLANRPSVVLPMSPPATWTAKMPPKSWSSPALAPGTGHDPDLRDP